MDPKLQKKQPKAGMVPPSSGLVGPGVLIRTIVKGDACTFPKKGHTCRVSDAKKPPALVYVISPADNKQPASFLDRLDMIHSSKMEAMLETAASAMMLRKSCHWSLPWGRGK
jgi:hypothetical protein